MFRIFLITLIFIVYVPSISFSETAEDKNTSQKETLPISRKTAPSDIDKVLNTAPPAAVDGSEVSSPGPDSFERVLRIFGYILAVQGFIIIILIILVLVEIVKGRNILKEAKGSLNTAKDSLLDEINKMKVQNYAAGARPDKGDLPAEPNRRDEGAITADNKTSEIDSKDAQAWYNKGILLSSLDRKEKALSAYNKAVEANPKDAESWYNKGNVLADLNRKEEALAAYNIAIKIDPRHARVWYNKGNVLADLDRKEEALATYDMATEFDPKYAQAWSNKGTVLAELGRNDEALAAYDKAIEVHPEDARAWYNKACLYSKINEKNNMLSGLKKAIELDPEYKGIAGMDEDFKPYWQDADFKGLSES